jgi:hypothetical protein
MDKELLMDIEGDLLSSPAPSEPVGAPAAPKKPAGKKRARAPAPAKPVIAGHGVVIIGNHFVCTFSGHVSERGTFITGVDDAVFANIPCAIAWLNEFIPVAGKDAVDKLKLALCTDYDQTVEQVIAAPPRERLSDFGGNQFYSEWIGELHFWDRLTEAHGLTVAEWKLRQAGSTVLKRGKGASHRIAFEATTYSIAYGKSVAGCKKVVAIDGAPAVEGAKAQLTPVKCYRKLQAFMNAHPDQAFVIRHFDREGFFLSALVPDETPGTVSIPPENKMANNIASQLAMVSVFGPATCTFTRKYSQKL